MSVPEWVKALSFTRFSPTASPTVTRGNGPANVQPWGIAAHRATAFRAAT